MQDNPVLDPTDIPEYVSESLGILRLSGSEQLFALDGQHRVVGIRDAVIQDVALGDEQITAIFVSHSKTPAGLERTRRLFTTLNRYAKPVNKRDLIALDEDDTVAIVTRRLVDNHALFKDKISVKHSKSMPVAATAQFTSIVALYDALDIYLRARAGVKPREWGRFKRFRRPDEEINKAYDAAVAIFDAVCRHFPEVKEMRDSPGSASVAGKYRSKEGGHLLFRPIGLSILMRNVANFREEKIQDNTSLARIAQVPMQLADEPWLGLLWDPENHRMIVNSENQNVATRIMYHGAGGDLRRIGTSAAAVGDELKGLLNRQERVPIKRYVRAE